MSVMSVTPVSHVSQSVTSVGRSRRSVSQSVTSCLSEKLRLRYNIEVGAKGDGAEEY